MKCVCVKACFGDGGINKKFKKGDTYNFEECPPHFEPVNPVRPPAEPVEEEPVTITELQAKTEAEEAIGEPTEDERNGENILEE